MTTTDETAFHHGCELITNYQLDKKNYSIKYKGNRKMSQSKRKSLFKKNFK